MHLAILLGKKKHYRQSLVLEKLGFPHLRTSILFNVENIDFTRGSHFENRF